MKKYKISDMVNGWFVGNFEPSLLKTDKCELALKKYKKGIKEKKHYHLLADEITLIVEGKARINNEIFKKGDIAYISKSEVAEFETLEETTTVVFKSASIKGDKYIIQ